MRAVGCHGRCQRYQAFARDRAAWLEKQRAESDMTYYQMGRARAAMKKWHTIKV